jgi:DNA-binding transcriptional regulator LsrR (DeoR family)
VKDLTPKQRITTAYLHYVRGITQEDLAAAFDVNQGRISESCTAILHAAHNPNRGGKLAEKTRDQ